MAKARLPVLVTILVALLGLVLFALIQISPDRAGLLMGGFLGSLLVMPALYLVALFFAIFVHEMGHYLAGRAVGFRFLGFVAGPLGWRVEGDRLVRYRVRPARLLGYVTMVPPDGKNLFPRFSRFILGGPLASLLWALFTYALWRFSGLPFIFDLSHGTGLLSIVASFGVSILLLTSVLILPGTLLPYRAKQLGGMPTDMLWLLMLRRGGEPARRLIASLTLAQMNVSGVRSRDLPLALIEDATLPQDGSIEEMIGLVYKWGYAIHHDPEMARATITRHAEVLTTFGKSLIDPWRASAFLVQALDALYLRYDADTGERWLQETSEPAHPQLLALKRLAEAGSAALRNTDDRRDRLVVAESAIEEAGRRSTQSWDWEIERLAELRKGWPHSRA